MRVRHDFVIVVPVADRPRHLAACLDSLTDLLRRFPYEGEVSVLIVDDSLDTAAIARHRALAEAHTHAGLPTHHLDRDAQCALVQALHASSRLRLAGVLGPATCNGCARLGASVARNLAYLWLSRLPRAGRDRLFWFVDSDERFQVEVETAQGGQPYDIDYLDTLDRIFSERTIDVLTGKVVGDPPVSPAVMALTLLDDVLAFLSGMTDQDLQAPCSHHGSPSRVDGAAYHDMADLFGYPPASALPYRCPLPGAHDHLACLAHFATSLEQFFDGVHPTRRSGYEPGETLRLTPARTVYTGNYVIAESALAWFIPYAGLKLRMAGPALGRLLKAQLGERFVSADLPLWHGRTLAEPGGSECRPGVEQTASGVDLSGEFERQYFGDVLLFTLEALIARGYPHTPLAEASLRQALAAVEVRIHGRYLAQQQAVAERIERLKAWCAQPGQRWLQAPALLPVQEALARFVRDLERNFGPQARPWLEINAPGYRQARLDALCAALLRHADECAAWQEAIDRR